MAGYFPPGFPFIPPPPPPRSAWSPPPPPTWHRPPESSDINASNPGGVVAGVVISFAAFVLVLAFFCSLCRRYGNSSANDAADAARAVAALAARPQAPPRPGAWDNVEQLLRRRGSDRDAGHTRPASLTAGIPSFTYNRAVRHNVTGSGDEATTCSVCLGAFQEGETVRLLPVCLHLYHVECIDPWLEAHTTCPLCRSGTEDPMMHGGNMLPPV